MLPSVRIYLRMSLVILRCTPSSGTIVKNPTKPQSCWRSERALDFPFPAATRVHVATFRTEYTWIPHCRRCSTWSRSGCCSSSFLVAGVSLRNPTCNTLFMVALDSLTVVVRVVIGVAIGWLRAAGRVVSRAVVISLRSPIISTIEPCSNFQTLAT